MVTREEIKKLNLERGNPIEYKLGEVDALPQLGYFQLHSEKEDGDILYIRIPEGSQPRQRSTGQYPLSVLGKVTKLQRIE